MSVSHYVNVNLICGYHSEGRDVRRSYFSSGSLDYISKSIPIFDILNEA